MMQYYPKNFIAATKEYTTQERHVNAPYFRKKFSFKKGKNAKIRICGLGFYELYLNGENITKGKLAPYISNPDEALYYDDYDVTDKLIDGENVVGILLGNGMQNAPYGDEWDFDKAAFRSAPKFAMALCCDGKIVFESDESFLTAPSPITFDDLRAGEHYDARQEIVDWNTLNAEESGWKNAILAEIPKGEATLVTSQPIRVRGEIKPCTITKTAKGYLYDFGEIFTGVCRLRVQGERGQQIQCTHGEIVIDGELDLRNIINVRIGRREGYDQCDWYTLKGEGVESYTPRFTYHGFRFVEVEGITAEQATPDLLTFEVWCMDIEQSGDFTCSDQVINIIQQSVIRSDLSNLFYVPTDCPHREKNGWTGDVALSAEQFMCNFSAEKVLADWLFSVRHAQDERGAIPGIVPTGGWGFAWGAGPNWDDALIETAYQVYRYTGNKTIIQDNLPAIEKYLKYMQSKRDAEGLFEFGLGDWAQPKHNYRPTTPVQLTDSIKCVDMCFKTAKFAKLVGKEDLQIYAQTLGESIRQSIVEKYIRDGKLTTSEQTALAYVLYYHIADEYKQSLQTQLLQRVQRDGVFEVGVLGARTLFRVLSEMGESDLAYQLITQDKYPSYGYHVIRGARTLFEQFFPLKEGVWLQEDGSKHDSLNHHFWGDVSAWFKLYLAGIKINPDFFQPNYVEISPQFVKKLSFAQGSCLHKNGEILSRWERVNEKEIVLSVTIPDGVFACLRLPKGYTSDNSHLTCGKQTIRVYKNV